MARYVVDNTEAEQKMRDLKEFRSKTFYEGSPTLKGTPGGADTVGYLPERFHEQVREADYVVYSYQTPIGWVTADGDRVIPDVGYSPTTGQHQYMVKDAWRDAGYTGSGTFPSRGREYRPTGGGPRRGGMDDPRW